MKSYLYSTFIITALATCNIVAAQYSFADITIKDGKINASFSHVKLEDALSEIADKTGIEIETTDALAAEIDVAYKDISLEQLLKNILVNQNVVYIRDPNTSNITSLRIMVAQQAIKEPDNVKGGKNLQNGNIAVHRDNGYYITVTINGKPLEMLIDTGADSLVISSRIASQFGLVYGDRLSINTAGGIVAGYKTVIDNFDMAGKNFAKQNAIILDSVPGNGLIGNSILRQLIYRQSDGKMIFNHTRTPNNSQKPNNPNTNENQKKPIQPMLKQVEPRPN